MVSNDKTVLDLRTRLKRTKVLILTTLWTSAVTMFGLAAILELPILNYVGMAEAVAAIVYGVSRKNLYLFSSTSYVFGNRTGSVETLWFEPGEAGSVLACFSDGQKPVVVADSLTLEETNRLVTMLNNRINEVRGVEVSEASAVW